MYKTEVFIFLGKQQNKKKTHPKHHEILPQIRNNELLFKMDLATVA